VQGIFYILFGISFLGLLHSYLLFPIALQILAKGKKLQVNSFSLINTDSLPEVYILLAVYNEEKVLAQKIESTLTNTNYPLNKVKFIIGNDASTDATSAILQQAQLTYPDQLLVVEFPGRTGKSGIINHLATLTPAHSILILTDANVFFVVDTIYQLVKNFAEPKVGLVGGHILNPIIKKDGISLQEKSYLDLENRLKYNEGLLFGGMIGAFGGCYSIRKSIYRPVPPLFFMDDFYITMSAIRLGYQSIMQTEATCIEDVSNITKEEYRRKVRISIGNWQNFKEFKGMLSPIWSAVGFSFLSHKVLRWFGPFFLLIMLASSIALVSAGVPVFLYGTLGLLGLFMSPLVDALFKQAGIHLSVLRFFSHFTMMNLALLHGFAKYVRGVDSNIWQPTQRNQ